MAVWALAQTDHTDHLTRRPDLLADDAAVDFYHDGLLDRTTVANLARDALAR